MGTESRDNGTITRFDGGHANFASWMQRLKIACQSKRTKGTNGVEVALWSVMEPTPFEFAAGGAIPPPVDALVEGEAMQQLSIRLSDDLLTDVMKFTSREALTYLQNRFAGISLARKLQLQSQMQHLRQGEAGDGAAADPEEDIAKFFARSKRLSPPLASSCRWKCSLGA